jgi:hypothetical protein
MVTRTPKGPPKAGPPKKSLRMLANDHLFEFHNHTLRRALYGITGDAIQILEEAAMYIEAGVPMPKAHAHFLAKRLKEIVASGDPWGKPIFARKKGQKGRDQYDRQYRIAHEVWRIHDRQKKTLEFAKAAAAAKFSVSEETAENHYRKFLPQFRK